ncbi:MAG: aspartate aminotransferase family protein, partial [Myxococcota bacterium]|nr:aspartate aminotransferase family protein [Myxococcota bacterium]
VHGRRMNRRSSSMIAAPAARRKPRRPLDGAAIIELDRRFILRPWTSIAEPVPIVRGRGLYVWDADGRRYMDFASGYFVNVAGHCHPRVMAAARRQLGLVTQATMRNITPPAALLAEKLVTLGLRRPGKLFYAVGGSEANEWGLKMARCRSGRPDVLALENAFHGLTLGTLAACSSAAYRKTAYHPLPGTIHFAPPPYCYRCRQKPQDCDLDCARKLERVVLDAAASGTPVGSFLFEPVQSVGGIIPPDRWYDEVTAIAARHGLLLIADEVQTGLGRTGRLFACEHWGLLPDVLTVAKGISGGVGSLGAAMAVDDVIAGFQGGTIPTGSGNAVSCAAGLALLEAVEKDDLAGNAVRMGARLTERVFMLDNRYVGDVRFKGLMGGVELVEDRTTKEPFSKDAMARIKEEMFRRGVIVTTSGPLGNVVRIQPPLTISAAQVDAFVAKLDEAVYAARTS